MNQSQVTTARQTLRPRLGTVAMCFLIGMLLSLMIMVAAQEAEKSKVEENSTLRLVEE